MSTTLAPDFTSQFNEATRGSPAWLRMLREGAMAEFRKVGFPTTLNEDWHYTNPSAIAEGGFVLGSESAHGVTATDVDPFTMGAAWPLLVFVNGHIDLALSRLDAMPAGVRVVALAQAVADGDGSLERRLGAVASFDEHAFTALNTAFLRDGAVIHVARDVEAAVPIHLLFLSEGGADGTIVHPRVIINAERHSKATVIESWGALGTPRYATNSVVEISVAEGATLTHLKVQRESAEAFHVATAQVNQAKDSHFVSFVYASGARLSRTNVYTHLNGPGCGSTLNGLMLANGTQHIDVQTRIEHIAPNCYSRELYKGVLDGEGHGVFNGKVYVHPEAQKTDGKQENHTLLLSERAQIDTKPQLEIFADDVRCTHGATIGRLDVNAEFYMKSRGIGAAEARKLLVYAFAADVLETIECEPVRHGLEALVLQRFGVGEA